MANLSDFMASVLPYVSGCSYPLAEQHIRNVCIDFCTIAPIVQLAIDPIDTVAGQTEYDIDVPNGSLVTLILEARYRGEKMRPFKLGDEVGVSNQRGEPTAFRQYGDNRLSVNQLPYEGVKGALTLVVATKPSRKTNTVDDILLEDYQDVIGLGVVSRILLMPAFANPQLAMQFKQTYEQGRTDARIIAEASFGQAQTSVKFRRFG